MEYSGNISTWLGGSHAPQAISTDDAPSANKPSSPLANGIKFYNEGNVQVAYDYFISMNEGGVEAAYYIGLSLVALSRYEEAMDYLEQVVTGALEEGGTADTKKGEVASQRVEQCRLILAVIYTLTERYANADSEIQKLLGAGYKANAQNKGHNLLVPNVYCTAAFVAWKERNIQRCIECYERALEADAQCFTALNGLGYVLSCEGRDLTRALDCCNKAVAISPRSAAGLDSLGCVYLKLGMKDEAISVLQNALAISRENGEKTASVTIEEHLNEAQGSRQ